MPVDTERLVSDEQVAALWNDGAICLRGLFADWVEPMRAAVEEVLDGPGPLSLQLGGDRTASSGRRRRDSFYIELGLWDRHPWFDTFARESPSLAIGHQILGSTKVNLFFDQLFVKEPGSAEQRTPWHQDQPYWPIQGHQVVSVWVTADPVTATTGALRYVRGSHRWDRFFRPYSFGATTKPLAGIDGDLVPDIDADPDRYEILTWDLEPGDCLVHHGRTIHGAPGNASSTTRRRAYSIRWTGDDVTWDPRPGVLEKITPMTTRAIPLQPGDPLDCEAFPRLRG